jgi:hypothetical protein
VLGYILGAFFAKSSGRPGLVVVVVVVVCVIKLFGSAAADGRFMTIIAFGFLDEEHAIFLPKMFGKKEEEKNDFENFI